VSITAAIRQSVLISQANKSTTPSRALPIWVDPRQHRAEHSEQGCEKSEETTRRCEQDAEKDPIDLRDAMRCHWLCTWFSIENGMPTIMIKRTKKKENAMIS
jgi:hypothetical protein